MMQTHVPPHPSTYYRYTYAAPSPPSDCHVLDLSKKSAKRPASPDYTYGYPSPKCSPDHDPPQCCTALDRRPLAYPPPSPKSPVSVVSSSQSDASSPKRGRSYRPFKNLAIESIALSAGAIEQLDAAAFLIDDVELGPDETKRLMEESARKYEEFREKMLQQLSSQSTATNQNMRRMQNNGGREQDREYLERRRKNNEAAKRSRDARRNKQDEIAIRATFLEQENIMLKCKVKSEAEDLERLRRMEFGGRAPIAC